MDRREDSRPDRAEPPGASWTPAEHPYGAFLHEVQKPARYLGGEFHSIRKPWTTTAIHVALAFPDVYEIGMSHLGMRILYRELNASPRIAAERAFAPWTDLDAQLRQRGLPLVSLENARPLRDFDIIGFSLQYELTFTNVLNMLDLAGIPIRASERDGRHPLIVAGGPVATQPEPMAPFIDCFLIGDGEHYFERFIEAYIGWRDEGLDRTEILVRLAGLGGAYCPALYDVEVEPSTGHHVVGKPRFSGVPERVQRRIVQDLEPHPFPSEGPVPYTEVIFDRFAVEIARGCTEGCRFCQAGMIYRPVRERTPEQIVQTLLDAVRGEGYDEVSLTALSTADFSCISPLVRKVMDRLREEKVSLSVSSLRAYGLADDLLESIADVRNTSLTFAPEAGSVRMRNVINKNISEEDMDRSAHAVFSRGWKRCKLYFMIGLPTEEDEDILEIVRVARKYLDIARHYHGGRTADVTASISTHVPKPHTPFQWAAMDGLDEITRKQTLLQKAAESQRVRLKWHEADASHVEGILARGDRRVADLVERAFRAGCRFDGWSKEFRFETWMRELTALGLDAAVLLRAIPTDARLPWDHIDVGVDRRYIEKEYRRALESRGSPPCSKPVGAKVHPSSVEEADADGRKLVCYDCGVDCDLDSMREDRRSALIALDALRRPAVPSGGEPAPGIEEIRARNKRPRTAITNRSPTRYRLLHTKLGRLRFLSHLDLVRMLPRLFRRSGLTMAYSLGFHPKPRMSFSPALPLGWGSRGEVLEVELEDTLDPAELLDRLNRSSPEGLRFLDARLVSTGERASRWMRVADYEVALPEGFLRSGDVDARIAALTSGGPVVVPGPAGEGERVIREGSVLEARLQAAAGIAGGTVEGQEEGAAGTAHRQGSDLFLRLRLDVSPPPRPDAIASFVLGGEGRLTEVHRLALWLVPDREPGGGQGDARGDGGGDGTSRAGGLGGDGVRELIAPLDLERIHRFSESVGPGPGRRAGPSGTESGDAGPAGAGPLDPQPSDPEPFDPQPAGTEVEGAPPIPGSGV